MNPKTGRVKIKRNTSNLVIIALCVIVSFSCDEENGINDAVTVIDYSKCANWISTPVITQEVDVFYVYPTVSNNSTGSMDIEDSNERNLALGIFAAQASVFESSANVFAPYYRQMSTNVNMDGVELATDTKEFKQGAIDIQDAFNYYINNFNEGRPFIIAGHSQGTMGLIELIKNRFGNDAALREKLVAAYLIGYTVTENDLASSKLSAAQRADDTGVVVSYNTLSTTASRGPMLMNGAICINPLNWETDNTYADNSENMGAVFFNDQTGEFLEEVSNYCDAQINLDSAAVTTSIPDDDLEIGPYSPGVYHRYDYAFWYRNLEANVATRINAYLDAH